MAKIQTTSVHITHMYSYKDSIWVIEATGDSGNTGALTLGEENKGGTALGPRFEEILKIINEQGYKENGPLCMDAVGIEVTYAGGPPIKVELSREGYNSAYRALMGAESTVDFDKDTKSKLQIYGYKGFRPHWESLPNDMSYFVRGYVVDAYNDIPDGDTIGGTRNGHNYGIEVLSVGDNVTGISPGDKIKVRYIGVDTPETKKGDSPDAYSIEKNTKFAKQYEIDPELTWAVADEAQLINRALFMQASGSVIVDLNRNPQGKIDVDDNGRYVGIVYKLPVTFDEPLPNNLCLNVNKSLLASIWSGSSDIIIPLAMPFNMYNENTTVFNDVALWANSVAADKDKRTEDLLKENAQYEADYKAMVDAERDKLKYNNETTVKINKIHVTNSGTDLEGLAKYYNTTIDAIIAANGGDEQAVRDMIAVPGTSINVPVIEVVSTVVTDPTFDFEMKSSTGTDNTLDFFDSIDDRREMDSEFHFRIGDVQLIVPPIAIDVQRTSNLEKVKALRTRSSIITKSTSSNTAITLQLYFHDLDSINGHAVKIGSHYEYEDVDPSYKEYTKHAVSDYYYMDGLRSLVAQFKRAPFLPVQNEFLNETLGIWNVALVNLSVGTVPGFPHSLSATLTLAKFEIDSFIPQEVNLDENINYPMLRWYYQQVMNPKYADNPYRTFLYPIEGELTSDYHFELADEGQLKERQNAIRELRFMDTPALHQDKLKDGKTEYSKFYNDYHRLKSCIAQQERYFQIKAELGDKFPANLVSDSKDTIPGTEYTHREVALIIYGGDSSSDAMFHPIELNTHWTDLPLTGVYRIKIEAERNKALIPTKYNEGLNYVFPADLENEGVLVVKTNGEAIQLDSDTHAMRYSKLSQKANESEGALKMNPYFISDMHLTNIQVMYENSFAPIQVQMLDNPSLQYLGSQDPYIQLSFETTDRHAIESLRWLLEETERFSREYRYGISSGFIGFQNQLSKLFGVTTVMPESLKVSTVPGFANRFQIQMTLCGFDKTQKRSESLETLMGTYMDTSLEDRHKDKDPIANDVVIIERKMRDLEVYPDLELPTVAELNAALKTIKAGINVYHNPEGAKYVDPDFYVSTKWTFRKYVLEERLKNVKMSLSDLSGMKGTMDSGSSDYFSAETDFGYQLDTIDAYTRTMTSATEGGDNYKDPNAVTVTGYDEAAYEAVEAVGAVKEWLKDANNVYAQPTITEWAKWYNVHVSPSSGQYIQTAYEDFYKNLKDPTGLEVYQEIFKWVDHYFVQGTFAASKNVPDAAIYKALTYSRMEDFYKAAYQYLVQTDPDYVGKNSPGDPAGITLDQYTRMANSVGNRGIIKITVDRIANYIKALLHMKSNWRQFRDNGSGRFVPAYVDGRVGMGAIPLLSHAKDIDMAKRLSWDWRYNVEYSIGYFFDQYIDAMISTDINIKCRPWDWAVRGYLHGGFKKYPGSADAAATYDGRLDTPEFGTFVTIFEGSISTIDYKQRKGALYNHPDAYAASPGSPVNEDILSHIEGVVAGVMDPNAVKGVMMAAGQARGNWTPAQTQAFKENLGRATGDISPIAERLGQSESGRLLVYSEDPKALHHDMFHDMVEYDQRGRLIRAFPTFQMFIIDEGRWMTAYKLWDNLYGFNSIQSIDVHKSRNIAADTAIIKMTNVYSNLTSRSLDENYGDWTYSFWDNLFWGKPDDAIIQARKELANSMMLKTGARIHLRMGYSADAGKLPVMFNGTITEMDTQDVVTIIAQGDGIELGNIVSADPKETNDSWWKPVTEPRDLICGLLTSRGNWFKDWMNYMTDGKLWGDSHPLGIMHFGNPSVVPTGLLPFRVLDEDFGEAAANIYSSNGANTFSEWVHKDGTAIGADFSWVNALNPLDWGKGDEENIEMKLEGQTVWDVAQNLALATPDYIAAVHPFEMRSTLFFGKPYYRLAYRYDSAYKWDYENNNWIRTVTSEVRKPYMQYHFLDSSMDLVANRIKASEEGVYTNVIATYHGGTSDLMMADWDIRFDKQKTATVQAPIVAQWMRDFWTSKKQANYYAMGVLRDYMKDMYKGQVVIMGDPSIKPYDMCYLNDEMNDMNGSFLVKEVTHHFSFETGFITSVSPDAIVIVDDKVILSHATWFASFAKSAAAYVIGKKAAAAVLRRLLGSSALLRGKQATMWTTRALVRLSTYLPGGTENVKKFQGALKDYMDILDDEAKIKKLPTAPSTSTTLSVDRKTLALKNIDEAFVEIKKDVDNWNAKGIKRVGKLNVKGLLYAAENIKDGVKKGKTAVQFLKVAGTGLMRSTVIGFIASVALTVVTETISEMWRRKKKSHQAVMMVPLQYQGREFTAGINGHRGMVVGDDPGKWDKFFMGMGEFSAVGSAMNFMFDDLTSRGSVEFTSTYEELEGGLFDPEQK